MNEQDSEFVKHLPCDACPSSDGMALYSDQHTHCFVCNTTRYPDGNSASNNDVSKDVYFGDLLQGQAVALSKRKLSLETCKKWDYKLDS